LLNGWAMRTDESSYYAEISILVDGWPWNLSEFDFRRWFAPGAMPSLLETAERMGETAPSEHAATLSENRRVAPSAYGRRRKRKHGQPAEQQYAGKRGKKHKYARNHGRKVA
jgi:hypothetical protein